MKFWQAASESFGNWRTASASAWASPRPMPELTPVSGPKKCAESPISRTPGFHHSLQVSSDGSL